MSGRDDRARIKRGTQPRKRAAPKPRAAIRKQQQGGVLALLPPPVALATRRAANYVLVAAALGVVIAAFIAMRLPQMIGIEAGEAIGRAGFVVKRIEIKGIDRMDRKPVEDAALDQHERAMPLVDIAAIRAKLLEQGWVADARVSRRLPDTLVIDIVERQPAAIWQNRKRLALIDQDGRIIEQVRLEGSPLPDLPIVIGPGANFKVASLNNLMAASPALKPMLDGATWIGARRWDIRFRSGETLSLPEGDQQARLALKEFAQRDNSVRLLGRGIVRFDMRVPGRMVVRKPKIETPVIEEEEPRTVEAKPDTVEAPAALDQETT